MNSIATESEIWVRAHAHPYKVQVGYGLLGEATVFRPYVADKKVFIVSDTVVAAHYLSLLVSGCQNAGAVTVEHCLIPAGEVHKTLHSAEKVWSHLLQGQHHRDTLFIALGGGMVGDLTGFCAALYMRGAPLLQCPTSLLAQIDAAIGGKVAVNHVLGKNMLGTFYPPQAVLVDLATLASLPERAFVAGLAELIKYAVSLDGAFFSWLEVHIEKILQRDPEKLMQAVRWACQIKALVVSQDEKEKGYRKVLNFGHTLAHAIESCLNYTQLLHGEAVAWGMVFAADLSVRENLLAVSAYHRIVKLLKKAGLLLPLPALIKAEVWSKIKCDKKHARGVLQWVLLKGLGEAIFMEIASSQQEEALNKLVCMDS